MSKNYNTSESLNTQILSDSQEFHLQESDFPSNTTVNEKSTFNHIHYESKLESTDIEMDPEILRSVHECYLTCIEKMFPMVKNFVVLHKLIIK